MTDTSNDSETLEEQIVERAREIKTDGYAMSVGEVLSLYRDGDLDIHPEFQRIYRWNDTQKSRLIESILLGIPIPPIFVSQRDNGVWDVIDGVQRLSTLLEFMGEYRNADGEKLEPSTMLGTEYLPKLDGYRWEVTNQTTKVFTDTMRRDVKRARLEFRIIKKESDQNAKYDLFQRLNSGAQLSDQEARNCLLVMMNMAMFNTIVELAKTPEFVTCVPLSDNQEDRSYRQELVLRFFMQDSFDGSDSQLQRDLGEYLTTWMRSVAQQTKGNGSVLDITKFQRVFRLLGGVLEDAAFRRWDPQRNRHMGPFSIACYEFVASGVAAHLDWWEAHEDQLVDRIRAGWSAEQFRSNSGGGVSPRRRLPKLVNAARTFFGPEI